MGISIFGPLQAPSLRRSPPLPPTGRHGVEGGAMEDETVSAGRARPFLNTRQAGHYLGLTPRHLERLRSEEHTSELQSLMRISYAVFCLKKKNKTDWHVNYLNTHQRHQ